MKVKRLRNLFFPRQWQNCTPLWIVLVHASFSMEYGWIYFVRLQKIHMRTDAQNLVPTARTFHIPKQKETIHMISMLQKEACSSSIHDLGHIPPKNCLANCLTKASAKADNPITAAQTGTLFDVDIHPDFGTLTEHKATISGDVCGDATYQGEKKNRIRVSIGVKVPRNITSAPAESCIQFLLCLALMNLLLGVVPHSSSLVTMAISVSHWDYFSQSEGRPSVDHHSWFPSSSLHVGYAHGRTEMEAREVLWILCGSSSWRNVKIRKENLSLPPNGQFYAVIFVNDPTIMNQKYAHWTMTGFVFGHFMRNRDDLCFIVKNGAQKEHNHSLLVQWFSCVARILFFQQFFFFWLLSDNLLLSVKVSSQIFNSLFNSRRLSNWYDDTL